MPALSVGAFGTVSVTQAQRVEEHLGDFARSFGGQARSDSQGVVTGWRFRTGELSQANAASLRSTLLAAPPISCSGDVLGGTIDCHPRNVQTEYGNDGDTIIEFVSFELYKTAGP